MGNIIQKSFLAIQLILSRSLSHWKVYFTVVVGVLLSSMIMAGTVLYFDALKEIFNCEINVSSFDGNSDFQSLKNLTDDLGYSIMY